MLAQLNNWYCLFLYHEYEPFISPLYGTTTSIEVGFTLGNVPTPVTFGIVFGVTVNEGFVPTPVTFGIEKAVPNVGVEPIVINRVPFVTDASVTLPTAVTLGTVKASPNVGVEPAFHPDAEPILKASPKVGKLP